MSEKSIRPTNLDPAALDAPEDVEYEEMLEAARLADEATALGKVVDDDTTPRPAKNKSWRE